MKVINDLYDYENYKIVQDSKGFKFSLDSILLAEYVDNVNKSDKILDLCCGNAAVPLILSYYYQNEIVGFEIQEDVYNLAKESILLNQKSEQIKIINEDVKMIKNYFPGNNFKIIVANPPYFKVSDSSFVNEDMSKRIARHEVMLDLDSMFQVVKYALMNNGIFYLVHLPERLEEILCLCEKYGIRCKEIQFVYTKPNDNATVVLLKCVKGAHNGLKVKSKVFVNNLKSYKNIFRR